MNVYNEEELQTVIGQASELSGNVQMITDDISTSVSGIDARLLRYYADVFEEVNQTSMALDDEINDINNYNSWLNEAFNDYLATKKNTEDLSDQKPEDIQGTLGDTTTGQGDAPKTETKKLNPSDFQALPPNVQDAVRQKLKELGYNDAEIEKILSGQMEIDQATWNAINGVINAANANGEAGVSQGTTGGDGSTGSGESESDTPHTIIGGLNPGDNGGTGGSGIGIGSTGLTDVDGLLGSTNGDSDDVMGDLSDINGEGTNGLFGDASVLAGSLGNSNGIVPKTESGIDVKKGSVGAGIGIAGLGGLAAAAGSVAIAGKKKKDEDEDGETNNDEDDLDNVEILDGDADIAAGVAGAAGIAGIIAAELALSEKDNKGEEDAKKEEEQKAFVPEAAIGEEFKPKKRDENDKSWLYGLGIGLAGAALASDDDDEEDEEEAF